MNKMIELRQARTAKLAEVKKITDAAEAEERDLNEDEKKLFEDLMKVIGELGSRIERLEAVGEVEDDSVQRSERRTFGKAPAYNRQPLGEPTEERAMATFIRTGDGRGLAQLRAANDTIANEAAAADGLNAVPTGHYNQIIARRDETALFGRLGVRRIPGKGLTVNVPLDGEADLAFAATLEQIDDYSKTFERDWPALGTAAMTLVKYTKKIALTDELLEDEDSNLLAFIADFVGRSMAATHNSLLLTEARAGGTAGLTFDSASTIAATEIPELVFKLNEEYLDNAAWVMARGTEGLLRGLTGSAFYFDPTPNGTTSARSLWGYPVYGTAAASAIAASAKSVIFGNFNFMGMREGENMGVLRDPYTTDGIVYLKYRFRAVYKTLQAEAIQYATHPTA